MRLIQPSLNTSAMKTFLNYSALLSALALCGALPLASPTFAFDRDSIQNLNQRQNNDALLAQWRDTYRPSGQVQQLLNRIESRTDRFRENLDRALDESRFNGSDREDEINQYVRDFEVATNRLRDRYYNGQYVAADLQEVVRRANRIDNFMRRQRLGLGAERDWAAIRLDLNQLGRITNGVTRRYYPDRSY